MRSMAAGIDSPAATASARSSEQSGTAASIARWRAWERTVRKRSMPATPRSVPTSAHAHRGMRDARREEVWRAATKAHATIRPATPATAWRSRNTDTSGFMPARESLRATDSLVDPSESRAEALTRRTQVDSAEGPRSCTRPWATRSTKEGRRARAADRMKTRPAPATRATARSRACRIHGVIGHRRGFWGRC